MEWRFDLTQAATPHYQLAKLLVQKIYQINSLGFEEKPLQSCLNLPIQAHLQSSNPIEPVGRRHYNEHGNLPTSPSNRDRHRQLWSQFVISFARYPSRLQLLPLPAQMLCSCSAAIGDRQSLKLTGSLNPESRMADNLGFRRKC
jgi:hypothetical protein